MRYTSRIDAGVLMRQAREELAESDPDSFLAMLLALAAGLRRGEIDRLLWRNVDFARGRIIIEESEHGQLKTEDSRGTVDIDPRTVEILRGFQAKAQGQFVIEAKRAIAGEASRAWGNRYRCVRVFERVNRWLRAHGIEGHKALHVSAKRSRLNRGNTRRHLCGVAVSPASRHRHYRRALCGQENPHRH